MDAITPDTPAPKAMDTGALKRFAQEARRTLRGQVQAKLAQVRAANSAARRESPKAVKELEDEIAKATPDDIVECAAYTWFNRFTALRFMDANGYTNPRVVTPADGQMRPEILAEAVAGNIADDIPAATVTQIRALLDGGAPSRDPQGEAYRLLVVAACNHWHAAMPFMFEPIADWTELLMPEDLLSPGSILAKLRTAMTDDACQDVETIGWLYQFYISEKKDEVFAGLKKNVKITPENIPAATQLFTPHWIVRYLVENSLGRLWLLNRPASRLAARMDYYIAPAEPEMDFLRIAKPEDIKICDPACGSGHMLTYAFDLLYAIYEEEGYDPAEIPALVLTHNLYGIEIDGRAGALAAFALAMKAAGRRKRFLRRPVQPNVCVLENVTFAKGELDEYVKEAGRDLFTADLRETLTQFAEAKNFGSLIVPKLKDVAETRRVIAAKNFEGNLFLHDVHGRVQTVLRMADYLSAKYHVVVANPPYMGSGGMNERLKTWAQNRYPVSKMDFFAMFIERSLNLISPNGLAALITMEAWMFLTSYTKLRSVLFRETSIERLVHLPYEGRAPTAMGISFGVCAFILKKTDSAGTKGTYSRLRYFDLNHDGTPNDLEKIRIPTFYKDQISFEAIPGWTIAFDASDALIAQFNHPSLSKTYLSGGRCKTSNDELFLRRLWEVSRKTVGLRRDWCLLSKGGEFRKYFGNIDTVMLWTSEAKQEYASKGGLTRPEFWDRTGITWTIVSSKGAYSFRQKDAGTQYNSVSPTIFGDELTKTLTYLNSKVASAVLKVIAPTLAANVGEVLNLPNRKVDEPSLKYRADQLVKLSRADWDSYETSWDFTTLPLLSADHRNTTVADTYAHLRAHWRGMTAETQRLEEENNRIFIDAYGLQDELTPEVALEEITLTCNPTYRYGGNKSETELEALLRDDTMREFVSYAVGCMFGRYSLDEPGLILASQGDGLDAYLARVPKPTFAPVAENVIPVLDGDWFADDIAARFRTFLRVTFGEARFQDNLAFVQDALGKDIGKYFVRDFFNDHVKRYRKRPIYWLFSSPRGTFNALIYMHRYRPDTVSTVLNDYLRPFRGKLEAHRRAQEAQSISGDATAGQKTKALKAIEAVRQQIAELDAWERDVLYPLATRKIEIDLDDGVKANYPKFGAALKPIKGLNDSDD